MKQQSSELTRRPVERLDGVRYTYRAIDAIPWEEEPSWLGKLGRVRLSWRRTRWW